MATKIDDVKLYEIQTYSFHDAVITVQETAHKRTEIDKPDGPNEQCHPLQYTMMAVSIGTHGSIGRK